MFNSPLEYVCAPLLIAQGLYTKWKTPKLAEASGVRSGYTVSALTPLNLFIVGDSAAAGVGVLKQEDALSGQLVELLKQNYQCTWSLCAKTGFTTTDLIHCLQQTAEQKIDIALISIGVNDVTKPLSVPVWKTQIQTLHHLLREKFSAQYIIYTAIPPMEHFPALPYPLSYFLGNTAKKMNNELNLLFKDQKNSTVLTLDTSFHPSYIAQDGFHPSAKTYQIWALHAEKLIHQYIENSK